MAAATPAERDAIHAAQRLIVQRYYDAGRRLGDPPDIDVALLRAALVPCLSAKECFGPNPPACCGGCVKATGAMDQRT